MLQEIEEHIAEDSAWWKDCPRPAVPIKEYPVARLNGAISRLGRAMVERKTLFDRLREAEKVIEDVEKKIQADLSGYGSPDVAFHLIEALERIRTWRKAGDG